MFHEGVWKTLELLVNPSESSAIVSAVPQGHITLGSWTTVQGLVFQEGARIPTSRNGWPEYSKAQSSYAGRNRPRTWAAVSSYIQEGKTYKPRPGVRQTSGVCRNWAPTMFSPILPTGVGSFLSILPDSSSSARLSRFFCLDLAFHLHFQLLALSLCTFLSLLLCLFFDPTQIF